RRRRRRGARARGRRGGGTRRAASIRALFQRVLQGEQRKGGRAALAELVVVEKGAVDLGQRGQLLDEPLPEGGLPVLRQQPHRGGRVVEVVEEEEAAELLVGVEVTLVDLLELVVVLLVVGQREGELAQVALSAAEERPLAERHAAAGVLQRVAPRLG